MPVPLEQAAVVIIGGLKRDRTRGGAADGPSRRLACPLWPLLRAAPRCRASMEAAGATVFTETLDVSDEAAVEAFAAATVERFGRIDV